MKKFFALLSCCLFALTSFAQNDPNLGIIPAPKSVSLKGGEFQFTKQSGILFETAEDYKIASLFHDFLKNSYFLDIPVAKAFIKAPDGVIRFSSSNYSGKNAEGYTLSINPKQINVSGKGAGLFYAMQSLMQIMPLVREGAPKIPCAEIVDEPRYKYRGMHLDVGRHMMPLSFIKKYIDVLAQYKLNTFHWHLTEDQGWRIEIKKYPKLTQVGGFRAQTLVGHYHDRMPQAFDNTPYGGFYTQDEVKQIVAYATSKYITVIPEIEMPGHSVAALAAYPELACGDNPGPFKTAENWGVKEDVYCAGKESTFNFLQDVLTEILPLFPSTYIHIGGDECPKTRWKACKYCQKRIADNNLKNEEELQSYFIHRMEKFLNSKGRQIIGWDEILQGGLAPNATVMSWTGVNGGIAAAKQNHDAIMTPGNFVYFDHYQGKSDQEPLAIGGYTPLQEVYSYDPTPSTLTPEQQKHIIGVQANVWTEYIATPQHIEYMIFPRMYALSEIAWTSLGNKNYTNFAEQRVPKHLAQLDKTNTVYRVPTAIGAKDTVISTAEYPVRLKPSVTGAKVYYTINGYTPRETDRIYSADFNIKIPAGESRTLKTIVITPSGKRSAVTTTTLVNEPSAGAPLNLSPANKGLRYFYMPGDFTSVAQLDTLQTAEKGIAPSVSVAKFRGKARTYGLVWSGYINIENDGVYNFATTSDDGSQLWIDNKLVVQNDGKHFNFETNGVANLLKGYHKIELRYFQGGGAGDFKAYITAPGKARQEIAESMLFN